MQWSLPDLNCYNLLCARASLEPDPEISGSAEHSCMCADGIVCKDMHPAGAPATALAFNRVPNLFQGYGFNITFNITYDTCISSGLSLLLYTPHSLALGRPTLTGDPWPKRSPQPQQGRGLFQLWPPSGGTYSHLRSGSCRT